MIRNRKLELEEACQRSEEQAKKGGIEVAEMRASQAQVEQRSISQPHCNKHWFSGTATMQHIQNDIHVVCFAVIKPNFLGVYCYV